MLQEKEAEETINKLYKLVSEATNTVELISIKFNLMIIADFLQDKIIQSLHNENHTTKDNGLHT